jgi:uncharacterized protein (TIRG00374 family)
MTAAQVRATCGFAIGGVFLYLALRHVHVSDLVDAVATVRAGWLILALCVYWMELAARVIRWRVLLLRTEASVTLGNTTSAFIIGYAANNVLPAKLGELVRVDLISRLAGLSRMAALGTVLVERIFDILLILLMAAISLGMLVMPETLELARLRGGMVSLGAICAVLLVVGVTLGRNGVTNGRRIRVAKHARLSHLVSGIRILSNPAECVRILLLSVLIWTLNGLSMWLIVLALGISLSVPQLMLLLGVVGLAAVLPAPPAGLGVLQYAFTLVFGLLGMSSAIGLVASATVQVALLGSVTVVGALLFFAFIVPLPTESRATDA